MNIQGYDVLSAMKETPYATQRELSARTGHCVGSVNHAVKELTVQGFLDSDMRLTEKAEQMFAERAPRNAIILAAGFGMRMVPINTEIPKGLLKVHGEILIERLIKQLHQAGIREIYVVVGFRKEQFEYLIDAYGVTLVVNPEYAVKNNLHSILRVLNRLSNSYIIPCDIWCAQNLFRERELYSWYMVSDIPAQDSPVRVNRKMELVLVPKSGNTMIGICYLLEEQAAAVREKIAQLCRDKRYDSGFWEEALYQKDRVIVPARVVSGADVVEINTYEQLRELDGGSSSLKSDAIEVIAHALHAKPSEITNITVLKKGMTNRSFLFSCRGRKYIMRIPGEGTERLINRREEAAVYQAIQGRNICDDIVYIDPVNGYKITEFWEGARVCDPQNAEDVTRCMDKLRKFHALTLTVDHTFDIFGQIDYYESLWGGVPSVYQDYTVTKQNVQKLRAFIDAHRGRMVLTHIDAVPDNFLFVGEELRLIDWEYAGMQDPHVDIAMFCIYSLYSRKQVDWLIDLYFEGRCPEETRLKIYCYIAVCGLLWSNWCEYKSRLGVEFGEYALRQYRYAKDYYRIVDAALKNGKE